MTIRLLSLLTLCAAIMIPQEPAVAQHLIITHGATLGTGPNWQGFPSRLVPDVSGSTGSSQLNGTYNIYLTNESDGANHCPEAYPSPILLTTAPWWPACCGMSIYNVEYENAFDVLYHTCPATQAIAVTLNSNGTLTLVDLNAGGLRDKVTISLYICTAPHFPPPGPCHENRIVQIILDRPGVRQKVVSCSSGFPNTYTLADVNALPDMTFDVRSTTDYPQPGSGIVTEAIVPQLTVEWVSTDAAGTSVRSVDAGDLGALSQELGYLVRWGFPGEPLPYPGAPLQNYRVNFAPFGWIGVGGGADHIDAGDIAAIGQDLTKMCGVAKTQAETDNEREAIMEWFGFKPTGRRIPVEPFMDAPEYVLDDAAQNQRAVNDPYGYRNEISSEQTNRSSWSVVKRLYR